MYRISLSDDGTAEIQIDGFKEPFLSDFSFWTRSDYERHWLRASKELANGVAASFITSITDPATSNFVRSWACYPVGRELVFQEQILFLDSLSEPFNLNEPHKNILPYEAVTEDGEKVSEWRVCV